MKDIVIVGGGGFGREVAWLIERINSVEPTWNILGFVDDAESLPIDDGYGLIGGVDWLAGRKEPIAAAVAIGSAAVRKKVCARLKSNGAIEFPNLVDPSVILSDRIEMGEGNLICAGTILTVDIKLGDFCIINLDCTVGHDADLRDFVTLYPSVNVSGSTVLEECVEMGTGSQIIQLRTIEEGTIVGAGAVVSKSLPAHCTAVGVPAKPIKFHEQK